MKVLVLSPYHENISKTISETGDTFVQYCEKFDATWFTDNGFDFVVSFGYPYLIGKDLLTTIGDRIINLHISYLPYCRGSHCNFWSHVEKTPSGVTIHRIDAGIDTGNILFQKEVAVDIKLHTFASSYKLLIQEIEELFRLNWSQIRSNELPGDPQDPSSASFHADRDLEPMRKYLTDGWDTRISDCIQNILDNPELSKNKV